MNVGELKAALADLPDDMKVGVINELCNDLDTDTQCDTAINHAGFRGKGGRSWRWVDKPNADNSSRALVIY